MNRTPSSKAFSRFRQHVNPLARRYQMNTELPENWPQCNFDNVNLPLYLDIGCGKGGFLLDDTTSDWLAPEMNYLGLEIRPGVSQYAQARVEKRGLNGKLSFVGCNANVDLDRLLTLYQDAANNNNDDGGNNNNNRLAFVSIQFPDPHFKKSHSKRRVVTPELVLTLSKFMKEGDVVFLQSDIQDALEAMRERFVEDAGLLYFDEATSNNEENSQVYNMVNPLGIPTEREVSVLKKNLPVFRTLFKRNAVALSS
ncbi:methyltransferase [Thalassiosira pseudonana CCMP1335]|uniref:tRNA (guanine(46)-N(7))-methyltransferase n=1 Tax=Thalassiosira pseudonana TaxID=35128 RepID=B8C0A6_THAPS|nr:methyltransferase [Thalassiosira pseudonana CCMP1335]EED93030.1 methyltransferase [Thalassiosira pseudonana CCMP1335]